MRAGITTMCALCKSGFGIGFGFEFRLWLCCCCCCRFGFHFPPIAITCCQHVKGVHNNFWGGMPASSTGQRMPGTNKAKVPRLFRSSSRSSLCCHCFGLAVAKSSCECCNRSPAQPSPTLAGPTQRRVRINVCNCSLSVLCLGWAEGLGYAHTDCAAQQPLKTI